MGCQAACAVVASPQKLLQYTPKPQPGHITCLLKTPQGSATQKVSDWALALAIPVHMHITTNACVTDYVPSRFRGASLHSPPVLLWLFRLVALPQSEPAVLKHGIAVVVGNS